MFKKVGLVWKFPFVTLKSKWLNISDFLNFKNNMPDSIEIALKLWAELLKWNFYLYGSYS